jgi:hypothetical protein
MNATKKVNGKSLVVVNKAQQKALSVPTAKPKAKPTPKAKTPKVAKPKQKSYHSALLECNRLDKAENFSLSGALNRLKKQIFVNDDYKQIDSNVLSEALTFDNLLKHVSTRCIDKQRFTIYALGLAVNKYLKSVL